MLTPVEADSLRYEERRHWTPTAIRVVVAIIPVLILALILFFLLKAEKWAMLAVAVVLLSVIIGMSEGAIRHSVALRVDEQGVGLTPAYRSRDRVSVLTPWAEIDTILVGRVTRGFRRIGIVRATVTAPSARARSTTTSTRAARSAARSAAAARVPELSLPMSNWNLDADRLRAAVNRFAPTVAVSVVGKP